MSYGNKEDGIDIKEIEEISTFNMPNTKQVRDGYDWKSVPEPTPENMELMMDKINELTKTINQLMRISSGVRYMR